MKRIFQMILIIFILGLVACSENEQKNDPTEGDEVTETNKQNIEQDANENESEDSEWGEDQLNLRIGDTGTVNNNFTSYEVTVNSVEYMDKIGDELPQNDKFVLVELTIKNLGKDSYSAEDILSSANLTESPGTSGTWPIIMEGIAEEWPGELSTNESQTGVLLFDISNSDEYALQLGTSHKSLSNEVRILFTDADAK